jgi:hypothetical protein
MTRMTATLFAEQVNEFYKAIEKTYRAKDRKNHRLAERYIEFLHSEPEYVDCCFRSRDYDVREDETGFYRFIKTRETDNVR